MSFPYSFPYSFPSAIMALTINFSATQSKNGKTITITDLSDWDNVGLVRSDYTRVFELTDANGQIITTLTLGATDVATYTVPLGTNPWINIKFDISGAADYELTKKYPFDRFFVEAYKKAINSSDCCSDGIRENISQANIFYLGAMFTAPEGNSVLWQQFVDTAYKFLK